MHIIHDHNELPQHVSNFLRENGFLSENDNFSPAEGDTAQALPRRLVIGLSGGLDSVCLMHLARNAGARLVIAHVNYQQRGAESDADQAFTEELARNYKLPIACLRAVKSLPDAGNFQENARRIRLEFFAKTVRKYDAGAILLAHHHDDQIETIFMKWLRAASPGAMQGMSASETLRLGKQLPPVEILRPLLPVTRKALEKYASEHKLSWREDSSNRKSDYARNFLRNEVFPKLEPLFPGWQGAVMEQSLRLRSLGEWSRIWLQNSTEKPEILPLDALRPMSLVSRQTLIHTWVTNLGAYPQSGEIGQIERLISAQPGRKVRLTMKSGTGDVAGSVVWREREALVFRSEGDISGSINLTSDAEASSRRGKIAEPKPSDPDVPKKKKSDPGGNVKSGAGKGSDVDVAEKAGPAGLLIELSGPFRMQLEARQLTPGGVALRLPFAEIRISLGRVDEVMGQAAEGERENESVKTGGEFAEADIFRNPETLWLDAESISWPLILRGWQPSDRIHPLGAPGLKLVSDLLTDRKIASAQKKEAIAVSGFDGRIHAVIFPHPAQNGDYGSIAEVAKITSETRKMLKINIGFTA